MSTVGVKGLKQIKVGKSRDHLPIVCWVWVHGADPVIREHSADGVRRERQNAPLQAQIYQQSQQFAVT